jgi:hypothetical protein
MNKKLQDAFSKAGLKNKEGIYFGSLSEVNYFLSIIRDYSTIPDNEGSYLLIYENEEITVKIL